MRCLPHLAHSALSGSLAASTPSGRRVIAAISTSLSTGVPPGTGPFGHQPPHSIREPSTGQ